MKLREGWSSHMAVLVKCLQNSKGPVLELGMGLFSTPLLHWLCIDMDRLVVSYENEPKYANYCKDFNRGDHKVYLIEDWDKIDIESNHWGMAFIDHSPEKRRVVEARRLANNTDLIVCHDTQPGEDHFYGYSLMWDEFKNVYHYEKGSPRTSVLSNFNDLEFFNSHI